MLHRCIPDYCWRARLPTRALSFLRHHGFDALPEIEAARAVARMTRRDLAALPNLGHGTIAALAAWLAGHGLELQPTPERYTRRRHVEAD
jgi:hypothetical protein